MNIILGLLILLLNIETIAAQQLIQNCDKQLIVYTDPQNTKPFLICTDCQEGYVLSFDFKTCISNYIYPYDYQYCRRLSRLGNCEEGRYGISIDQDKNFFPEVEYYDPRCAKVDRINKFCISPRFPFTLLRNNNQFMYAENSFCKIADGATCVENYGLFFISAITNNYFIMSNVVNPQLILPTANPITEEYKQCIQPYQSSSEGCTPISFKCKQHNATTCICSDGEALSVAGDSCMYLQNCQTYDVIGNENVQMPYCVKCKQNFQQNRNLECSVNCIFNQSSRSCQYCISNDGYTIEGNMCEITIKSIRILNCIKFDSNGICAQCADGYFYNLRNNVCEQRIYSLDGCKYVNPISDQCLTLECRAGFSFANQYQILFQSNISQTQTLLPEEYLSRLVSSTYNQQQNKYYYAGQVYTVYIQDDIGSTNLLNDLYYMTYSAIPYQMCTSTTMNIPGCTNYLGNICIECGSSNVYYVYSPNNSTQPYQGYCGYSESQNVQNCKVIMNNQCIKCLTEYILISGVCSHGQVPNCITYDSQTQDCLKCKQGYTLVQSDINNTQHICLFIPYFCDYEVNSSTPQGFTCKDCKDQINYQLVTTNNQQQCIPINQNGFEPCNVMVNGQCQNCISDETTQKDCQAFTPNYKCSKCSDNLILQFGMCYSLKLSANYKEPNTQYGLLNQCEMNKDLIQCNVSCSQGQYKDSQGNCQFCFNIKSKCMKCYKNYCLDDIPLNKLPEQQGWSELYQQTKFQCLDGKLLLNSSDNCHYDQNLNMNRIYHNYDSNTYVNAFPTLTDNVPISFNSITNQYICPDGSNVDSLNQCLSKNQKQCQDNYIFDINRCKYKCSEVGKIGENELDCRVSKKCQDALTWDDYSQQCIYSNCGNNLIALDKSSCPKTTRCIKDYRYNSISQSCEYSYTKSYTWLSTFEISMIIIIVALFISILILFFIIIQFKKTYKRNLLSQKKLSNYNIKDQQQQNLLTQHNAGSSNSSNNIPNKDMESQIVIDIKQHGQSNDKKEEEQSQQIAQQIQSFGQLRDQQREKEDSVHSVNESQHQINKIYINNNSQSTHNKIITHQDKNQQLVINNNNNFYLKNNLPETKKNEAFINISDSKNSLNQLVIQNHNKQDKKHGFFRNSMFQMETQNNLEQESEYKSLANQDKQVQINHSFDFHQYNNYSSKPDSVNISQSQR